MTAEEIKNEVDSIIKETFKRLQYAYLCSKPEEYVSPKKYENQDIFTNLIFPRYHNEKQKHHRDDLRISEQELRFAFSEEFRNSKYSKEKKWRYSIETPTKKKYINFSKGEPSVANGNEGRSALFDFVIHDTENKLICLIEFKAHNPSEQIKYHKDFVKLIHDMEDDQTVVRYFIQVLESYDDDTITSLANKLNTYNEYLLGTKKPYIIYHCYSLKKRNTNKNANKNTDKKPLLYDFIDDKLKEYNDIRNEVEQLFTNNPSSK